VAAEVEAVGVEVVVETTVVTRKIDHAQWVVAQDQLTPQTFTANVQSSKPMTTTTQIMQHLREPNPRKQNKSRLT